MVKIIPFYVLVGLLYSIAKAKVNFPQAYTRALLVADWLILLRSGWLLSIRVLRRIRRIEIHGKSDGNQTFIETTTTKAR